MTTATATLASALRMLADEIESADFCLMEALAHTAHSLESLAAELVKRDQAMDEPKQCV